MKNRLPLGLAAGALTAAAVLGGSSFASADSPAVPATATDTDTPPPAVEDFEYPGASPHPALKLLRGDGHIVLTSCSGPSQIQVFSRAIPNPNGGPTVCFRVTGTTGFLTLELPQTFIIQTDDRAVRASLTAEGVTQTVEVPADEYRNVGEGLGQKTTTLLELRVTG
ncbi:hypothetical protein ACFCX4_35800 [Kitasatospora sp. NPDC056327]|uniref:hypothetical protein n=1 Tax=Kitasatospora sp. NPDC056327 TaxID=3345785 RepID=UPI0035DB3F18